MVTQLREIDGFGNAKLQKLPYKPGVLLNVLDPVVTAALIGVIPPTLALLFKLIRERGKTQDHREIRLTVKNYRDCTFHINNRNVTMVEKELAKVLAEKENK